MKLPKSIRTIGFISMAIFLSKALGMLRDMLFASTYGTAGVAPDAFNFAADLPLQFFDLTLGAAVMSTFIPIFNKKEKDFDFANSFLNLVLLISSSICIIAAFCAPIISRVFLAGSAAEVTALAANLLVIMLPTMLFTASAYVFAGLLQSLGEYNVPAIISLVSNVVVIAYLVFFNNTFGIYGMACAILLGWALQVVVQIPVLVKKRYKYKLGINLHDSGLKEAARMSLPILISSWVQPLCVLFNTHFASYLDEGSISALKYANKLYILLVGVFSFAITNYIFPKLAQISEEKEFKALINKSLLGIIAVTAPIMLIMLFWARPIIAIIYQRGEFTAESTLMTASALSAFAIGMVALGVNEVLNKAFYAKQNGVVPMIGSIIGIAVNVTLVFVFRHFGAMSITTLALAQAISSNGIMLFLLGIFYGIGR